MNYKEFYDKIVSGEISLPLTVQVVNPPWDEFELDRGCKAKLISISTNLGSSSERLFKLVFDFSEFVEFNKQFWVADWNEGNNLVPFHETKWFKKSEGKCDLTADWYDEFSFTYSVDEKVLVSKVEYEKLKNFYEKNKNNH